MAARVPDRFPFDPLLPGLERALDPGVMRDIFARHLWRNSDPPVVEGCRVSRIRYRAGSRCLIQYALTLRDPGSATATRQTVTGMLYARPAKRLRLAHELPDAVQVADPDMLISIFPSDHKLTHARAVMEGRDPALREAVLSAFGDAGAWTIDSVAVDAIRYREGLSLVARYTVGARHLREPRTLQRVFYVKAYADRGAAREAFRHLRTLASHATACGSVVRVDPPVACLENLGAIVLPAAEGRPLGDYLSAAPEREALDAVRQASRALARFNTSRAPMRRRYTASEYVQSLGRPAAILGWACPELRQAIEQVTRAIAADLREVEVRPTHRDMKPEHLLLSGPLTTLIDLDSSAAADPVLDIALMLARFRAAKSAGDIPDERLDSLGAAFAEEYWAGVPADWRQRLPAYLAGSLIEVAAGLFHRQEPEWSSRVGPLVQAARETLRAR